MLNAHPAPARGRMAMVALPPESLTLQVTIGGYAPAGQTAHPVTVLAELDLPTGALLIDSAAELKDGAPELRRAEHLACTNHPGVEDRDDLFTEPDMRDAIDAYFDLVGRGLVEIDPTVQRYSPGSKVEADGLDERGRKYRFAGDISNGQVAVMVACWFARRRRDADTSAATISEFAEIQAMGLHTVGLGSDFDDDMEGVPMDRASGWPREFS